MKKDGAWASLGGNLKFRVTVLPKAVLMEV
jgi:hypothetical protein